MGSRRLELPNYPNRLRGGRERPELRDPTVNTHKFKIFQTEIDLYIQMDYVERIEMRSGSFAVVSQVAVCVDVESVQAGSQTHDGATNDNGSTCRRLFKAQLASDVGELCSAVDVGHG